MDDIGTNQLSYPVPAPSTLPTPLTSPATTGWSPLWSDAHTSQTTYLKRRPISSIHPSGGRSRAADAAIDALVYDLYRLTAEELKVVEGTFKMSAL